MAKKRKVKLKSKHYAGIGKICVSWAALELKMIEAVRGLIDTSTPDAIVMVWHMGYRDKIDRIQTLFMLHNPDEKLEKHFGSIITRMNDAFEIRNIVAHSKWVPGDSPDAISPITIQARGGKIKVPGHNIKEEQFSSTRLEEEAKKINRLELDFIQFFTANFGCDFTKSTPKHR